MRYIRYTILAIFMIVLVSLALANRGLVMVALLPEGLPLAADFQLELPLFAIIFASILVGLVLGYLLEFFREHKYRKKAAVKNREAAQLSAQVAQLKKESGKDDDDVLAILT
ncbi:MAG: lipopolysaccharide assembly protein LapA domain-containing protein [Rhodobacteraceae bacterium]|nr:lipopolysaccharide assembly protein LapA domain-containing protein [Paracoccaceae bacterium]